VPVRYKPCVVLQTLFLEFVVSLVVTFIVVSLSAAIVLWGISLFLQGYLYNEPADKLILRAAVGGLAIGCYLSFWVYANTRADRPNKYGAIHQFAADARSEPTAFQAVQKFRQAGNTTREQTVSYLPKSNEKGLIFLNKEDASAFKLNTADYITTAILVTEGASPARFEALLKPDGWTYSGEKKTFRENGGRRFIEADEPGIIIAPSGGTQLLAILLNLLTFLVLFVIFWPILRFGTGHAIGLSIVVGMILVLVLMPLLFDLNKQLVIPAVAPPALKG
jgi:hypothetical protein